MMTVDKVRKIRQFRNYGRSYMEYCIERDGLEEWKKRHYSYADFKQMLANANAPVFDPCTELGLIDPTGEFYDHAVSAAWDTWGFETRED